MERTTTVALTDTVHRRSIHIWHGDTTGYLLFESLWLAAERGVRIRLLIDDIGTTDLDDTFAALDSHANIEVVSTTR